MTPCANCGWPHYSPVTIDLICTRCSTPIRVIGKDPELNTIPTPKRPTKDSRFISWIALFRTPEDRGVGDTVERLLAKAGGRKIKAALKKLKIDCECSNRQVNLNKKHPYR